MEHQIQLHEQQFTFVIVPEVLPRQVGWQYKQAPGAQECRHHRKHRIARRADGGSEDDRHGVEEGINRDKSQQFDHYIADVRKILLFLGSGGTQGVRSQQKLWQKHA